MQSVVQLEYGLGSQVSVKVRHTFSVEFDETKRKFIMAAHSVEGMCLFGDVDIFNSPEEHHYCYTCCKKHSLPQSVDVLASGPSCKKVSKMNGSRAEYAGCFLVYHYTMTLL